MSRRCEKYIGRHLEVHRCTTDAELELIDPEGAAQGVYCKAHGRAICRDFEDELGELWTLRVFRALELVA